MKTGPATLWSLATVAVTGLTVMTMGGRAEDVRESEAGVQVGLDPVPAVWATDWSVAGLDEDGSHELVGELLSGRLLPDDEFDFWVEPWTPDDVIARIAWATPRARCIVRSEVGGVGYDPYRNGRQGELGPVQLHPRGKLPEFYARGYRDPHSPHEAVDYLEWALANGQAGHWTAVVRGLC